MDYSGRGAAALSASRGSIAAKTVNKGFSLSPSFLPSFLPLSVVTLSFVAGSRALTEKR